jgi:hypothetical protein
MPTGYSTPDMKISDITMAPAEDMEDLLKPDHAWQIIRDAASWGLSAHSGVIFAPTTLPSQRA